MKIATAGRGQSGDQFLSVQKNSQNNKELAEKLLSIGSPVQDTRDALADDAVRVKLSEHSREVKPNSRPEAYDRLRRIKRPDRAAKPDSIFTPGKPIYGKYSGGEFKTHSGFEGTYHGLPGGQIGFSVEGFHGVLAPNGKAIAVNPETGEAYAMEIKYRGGQFKVSGVREIDASSLNPGNEKPILVEKHAENISFRYNDSGKLAVEIKHPKTGELIKGEGYLSPKGVFMLALDNGATIMGAYRHGEEGLEIYSRSAL